jgi:hypothetical protein
MSVLARSAIEREASRRGRNRDDVGAQARNSIGGKRFRFWYKSQVVGSQSPRPVPTVDGRRVDSSTTRMGAGLPLCTLKNSPSETSNLFAVVVWPQT